MPEEVITLEYPDKKTIKLSEVMPDIRKHGMLINDIGDEEIFFMATKRIIIKAGG